MSGNDDALYTETMHVFLGLYRYLRQHARQMQEQGLSGRQVATLRYLLEAGPQTIGQLRDYLYIGDSSTSELVAHMEQAGLVTRTRSGADSRVVLVALTPAGQEAAEKTALEGIPLLREKLKSLPPERLLAFRAVLVELKELLEIPDDR
jgi:MarR family transcriptional regulator, organic hydroperoxide resistance regulator